MRTPSFEDGAIGLSFMDAAYSALNRTVGKEVVAQFWAFGDTEEEVFDNLNRLFKNLFTALKGVSTELVEAYQQQAAYKKYC